MSVQNAYTPGRYGQNAAKAYQRMEEAATRTLLEKNDLTPYNNYLKQTIEYSGGKNAGDYADDALGYAGAQVDMFDRNGDRNLNADELSEVFGGDTVAAGRFAAVVDTASDGVDSVDLAGYTLFQDDAFNQLYRKARDLYGTIGGAREKEAAQYLGVLLTAIHRAHGGGDLELDGRVTQAERAIADLATGTSVYEFAGGSALDMPEPYKQAAGSFTGFLSNGLPGLGGMIMREMKPSFDLESRHQSLKDKGIPA